MPPPESSTYPHPSRRVGRSGTVPVTSSSTAHPHAPLQHACYVLDLARAVVFDAVRAREVEQETWLAALEHAPRDLRAPRAWLATLVRNAARRLWARAAERAAREPRAGQER